MCCAFQGSFLQLANSSSNIPLRRSLSWASRFVKNLKLSLLGFSVFGRSPDPVPQAKPNRRRSRREAKLLLASIGHHQSLAVRISKTASTMTPWISKKGSLLDPSSRPFFRKKESNEKKKNLISHFAGSK